MLAGDTARSCADLELPMLFLALASREGHLRQHIEAGGRQVDQADPRDLADWATPLDQWSLSGSKGVRCGPDRGCTC